MPRGSAVGAAQRDGLARALGLGRCRLVVPRQPLAGIERDLLVMALERDEVVELPVAIIRPLLLALRESIDERTVASRVSSIHARSPAGHCSSA